MHRVILLPHEHVLEEAALNQGFALTLKYQPQNRPDVNANDLFFCAIAIQSMQQAIGSHCDIQQFKLIEHVLQVYDKYPAGKLIRCGSFTYSV